MLEGYTCPECASQGTKGIVSSVLQTSVKRRETCNHLHESEQTKIVEFEVIIILHAPSCSSHYKGSNLFSVAVVWLANSGPRPDGHKVILVSERIVQRLSSCNILLLTYTLDMRPRTNSPATGMLPSTCKRAHSVSLPHTWFQT